MEKATAHGEEEIVEGWEVESWDVEEIEEISEE
jgi:hypothetical protein